MPGPSIAEKDLKGAAEKALQGNKAGAVAELVGVLAGAFTGHPILGVAFGRGAEWFVKGAVDRATQPFEEAGHECDEERERVEALAREIADGLSPVWAQSHEELSAQATEQEPTATCL
jgi:hypothetical protein